MRLCFLAIVPVLFLAACGKPPSAASSLTTTTAGGIEKIAVRVADPNNPGKYLVEVDWLRFTGTRPVDAAANKWLEDVGRYAAPTLTETEAIAFANPVDTGPRERHNRVANVVNCTGIEFMEYDYGNLGGGENNRLVVKAKVVLDQASALVLKVSRPVNEHLGCSSIFDQETISLDPKTGELLDIKQHLDKAGFPLQAWANRKVLEQLIAAAKGKYPAKTTWADLGVDQVPMGPSRDTHYTLEEGGVHVVVDDDFLREKRLLESEMFPAFTHDFTIPYADLQNILPTEWLPPVKK